MVSRDKRSNQEITQTNILFITVLFYNLDGCNALCRLIVNYSKYHIFKFYDNNWKFEVPLIYIHLIKHGHCLFIEWNNYGRPISIKWIDLVTRILVLFTVINYHGSNVTFKCHITLMRTFVIVNICLNIDTDFKYPSKL